MRGQRSKLMIYKWNITLSLIYLSCLVDQHCPFVTIGSKFKFRIFTLRFLARLGKLSTLFGGTGPAFLQDNICLNLERSASWKWAVCPPFVPGHATSLLPSFV